MADQQWQRALGNRAASEDQYPTLELHSKPPSPTVRHERFPKLRAPSLVWLKSRSCRATTRLWHTEASVGPGDGSPSVPAFPSPGSGDGSGRSRCCRRAGVVECYLCQFGELGDLCERCAWAIDPDHRVASVVEDCGSPRALDGDDAVAGREVCGREPCGGFPEEARWMQEQHECAISRCGEHTRAPVGALDGPGRCPRCADRAADRGGVDEFARTGPQRDGGARRNSRKGIRGWCGICCSATGAGAEDEEHSNRCPPFLLPTTSARHVSIVAPMGASMRGRPNRKESLEMGAQVSAPIDRC